MISFRNLFTEQSIGGEGYFTYGCWHRIPIEVKLRRRRAFFFQLLEVARVYGESKHEARRLDKETDRENDLLRTVITEQQLWFLVFAEVQRRHQMWLRCPLHVNDPRAAGSGDQLEMMPNSAAEHPFVHRVHVLDYRHQRRCFASVELLQQQETFDGVRVGC